MLQRNAFKKFAKDELILLHADFPSNIQQPRDVRLTNEWLKRSLNVGDGVPCTVLLSPEGVKLGEIPGYLKEAQYLKEILKLMRDNNLPHRDRWK